MNKLILLLFMFLIKFNSSEASFTPVHFVREHWTASVKHTKLKLNMVIWPHSLLLQLITTRFLHFETQTIPTSLRLISCINSLFPTIPPLGVRG